MKKDDAYKEQKHLLNIKQNIWHHKICYIEMAINCFIVCIEKKRSLIGVIGFLFLLEIIGFDIELKDKFNKYLVVILDIATLTIVNIALIWIFKFYVLICIYIVEIIINFIIALNFKNKKSTIL